MSINRNILECKYKSVKRKMVTKWVLIETYWNVNIYPNSGLMDLILVLIETYWNVNYEFPPESLSLLRVLIETYWNVNFI